MTSIANTYHAILSRIQAATAHSQSKGVRLLAVSKGQPATAIRALATLGQNAFGENYVQEALAKQNELINLNLEWHYIGPLQSNKCRMVAERFDWLHSLDRLKLIEPLNRYRPPSANPLNVLIEVNIDDETQKSGCAPSQISELVRAISAAPRLMLRGLMAIPQPQSNKQQRRIAFQRMRQLFEATRQSYPHADTLSMGMSEDFELAIMEGSTLVRVGSALFGPRG